MHAETRRQRDTLSLHARAGGARCAAVVCSFIIFPRRGASIGPRGPVPGAPRPAVQPSPAPRGPAIGGAPGQVLSAVPAGAFQQLEQRTHSAPPQGVVSAPGVPAYIPVKHDGSGIPGAGGAPRVGLPVVGTQQQVVQQVQGGRPGMMQSPQQGGMGFAAAVQGGGGMPQAGGPMQVVQQGGMPMGIAFPINMVRPMSGYPMQMQPGQMMMQASPPMIQIQGGPNGGQGRPAVPVYAMQQQPGQGGMQQQQGGGMQQQAYMPGQGGMVMGPRPGMPGGGQGGVGMGGGMPYQGKAGGMPGQGTYQGGVMTREQIEATLAQNKPVSTEGAAALGPSTGAAAPPAAAPPGPEPSETFKDMQAKIAARKQLLEAKKRAEAIANGEIPADAAAPVPGPAAVQHAPVQAAAQHAPVQHAPAPAHMAAQHAPVQQAAAQHAPVQHAPAPAHTAAQHAPVQHAPAPAHTAAQHAPAPAHMAAQHATVQHSAPAPAQAASASPIVAASPIAAAARFPPVHTTTASASAAAAAPPAASTAVDDTSAGLDSMDGDDVGAADRSFGPTGFNLRSDSDGVKRKSMLASLRSAYEEDKEPKRVMTIKELLRVRDAIRLELSKGWPSELKTHKLLLIGGTGGGGGGGMIGDRSKDPLSMAVKFVKSVLNKLTRENFNKLSLDLIRYNVASQEMLEKMIEVVFDKALEDVKYQDLYADLCKLLGEKAEEWSKYYLKVAFLKDKQAPAGDGWYYDLTGAIKPEDAEWSGPVESEALAWEKGKRETNFKRLLLNRCQQEFTKANPKAMLTENEEEDAAALAAIKAENRQPTPDETKAFKDRELARRNTTKQAKKRMLANVSFIGHLFTTGGQLTVPIIHYCVLRLLGVDHLQKDPAKASTMDFTSADYVPDPEGVEALCQ